MTPWNPWAEWWLIVRHPFRYVAYARARVAAQEAGRVAWSGVRAGMGKPVPPQTYVQINPTQTEWKGRPVA